MSKPPEIILRQTSLTGDEVEWEVHYRNLTSWSDIDDALVVLLATAIREGTSEEPWAVAELLASLFDGVKEALRHNAGAPPKPFD